MKDFREFDTRADVVIGPYRWRVAEYRGFIGNLMVPRANLGGGLYSIVINASGIRYAGRPGVRPVREPLRITVLPIRWCNVWADVVIGPYGQYIPNEFPANPPSTP